MESQPASDHAAVLQAFSRALTREAHVLTQHPDLLWQQMYNRLQWEEDLPRLLEPELARRSRPGASPWFRLRSPYQESAALTRTLAFPEKETSSWLERNNEVTACAISPDGRTIVAGYRDHILRIWDSATGTERFTMQNHHGETKGCFFTPNGKWIVTTSSSEVIENQREFIEIWDVNSGNLLAELQSYQSISISPDSRWLVTTGSDSTLKIWNTRNWSEAASLCGHTGKVNSYTISLDGRWLVTASEDKTLKIWNTRNWVEAATLYGHTGEVTCCAISPNGRLLVSGSMDQMIKTWDLASGMEQSSWHGHQGGVVHCKFSPDGSIILSRGGTIYDETRKDVKIIRPTRDFKSWDVKTGRELLSRNLQRFGDGLVIHPNGRWVVSPDTNRLILWDLFSDSELASFQTKGLFIEPCGFSPDGTLLASISEDKILKLWEVSTQKLKSELKGHSGEVKGCLFSQDGHQLISWSNDVTIKIWDPFAEDVYRLANQYPERVTALEFSPDGNFVVSADQDTVLKSWDFGNGSERGTYSGQKNANNRFFHNKNPIWSFAISPDGNRIYVPGISTSEPGNIGFLMLDEDKQPPVIFGSRDVLDSHFSPDRDRVLIANRDNNLYLWDAITGKIQLTLRGHSQKVNACAFSPDGHFIISASQDSSIKIWAADSGDEKATLFGHSGGVNICAFSPDGKWIVSGGDDGNIKIWDPLNGKAKKTLAVLNREVQDCAISPDNEWIFSVGMDRSIRIWSVKTSEMVASMPLMGGGRGLALHPCLPSLICWDTGGHLYLSDLVGIQYGALYVTAIKTQKGYSLTCPACRQTFALNKAELGRGMACHNNKCARPLMVNATYIHTILNESPTKGLSKNSEITAHVKRIPAHSKGILSCAISPDGTWILTAGMDWILQVRDSATGNYRKTLTGHSEMVTSCAINSDGTWCLSASEDGRLEKWDTSKWGSLCLIGHTEGVWSCAISPDDTLIASGSKHGSIKIWDSTTRLAKNTLRGQTQTIRSLAFSPDGTWLVSGCNDATIKVWKVAEATQMKILRGHANKVNAIAISPDNTWMVTASDDHDLFIWDVNSWSIRTILEGHTAPVMACAITPDGKWILSTGGDNSLKIWNAKTGKMKKSIPLEKSGSCLAVDRSKPIILCGDMVGGFTLIHLEGMEFGPLITTPIDIEGEDSLTLRCPACRQEFHLERGFQSKEVICPNNSCATRLLANPFCIHRSAQKPKMSWFSKLIKK